MSDRRRKKKKNYIEVPHEQSQKDKIKEKEDKKEETKEEEDEKDLEIKPEEIPFKPNSLKMDILLTTASMQHQNGVRVGDYLRYSHFCRKKIQKLRKLYNLTQGKRKYQKRPITAGLVTDNKIFLILILECERNWAYGTYHKLELTALGEDIKRLRYDITKKFKRSSKNAQYIFEICKKIGDTQTQLEAEAYYYFIHSNYLIFSRKFEEALELLKKACNIYEKIKQLKDTIESIEYEEKIKAMKTSMRLCIYNLSSTKDTILDEQVFEKTVNVEDIELTEKIEEIKKGANKINEEEYSVKYHGIQIPIKNEKLKNNFEKLNELNSKIEKEQDMPKKTVNLVEKVRKKSRDKEKKNSFLDNDKSEKSAKQTVKKKMSKKLNDNDDKLSKSFTLEQKKKNNSFNDTNSSSNNNNNSLNFNLENNTNKKLDLNTKMNKSFNKIEKDKEKDNIINNIKKNQDTVKSKNQRFNSKIITNVEDLDLIARGLVKDDIDSLKNLRVGYKLIYRSSEHGKDAEDFHEKCDDIEGTLTIIKTKEGNIFGGYTSLSWDPEEEAEKKDNDAFVFSLNLEKLYFESGQKDYSIFCDKNKGPCFVGMFAVQENILKNKSYINPWGIQCFSGEYSNYEINGGKNEFFIEELEVFQVIVKRN